jgi:hypothetical protein
MVILAVYIIIKRSLELFIPHDIPIGLPSILLLYMGAFHVLPAREKRAAKDCIS